MSRDGLIRENMTTGETENISAKAKENPQPDNVINEDVTSEKIMQRKSSGLTFTEEERAIPELQKYIKKSDQAADQSEVRSPYGELQKVHNDQPNLQIHIELIFFI